MRSSNYNMYHSLSNFICNNLLISVPCNFAIVIIAYACYINKISLAKSIIIALLLFILEIGFSTLLNRHTYKNGYESVNSEEKQDFKDAFLTGIVAMTIFTLFSPLYAILFAIINCKLLFSMKNKE